MGRVRDPLAFRRVGLGDGLLRVPEQILHETHLGPVGDAPFRADTDVLPSLGDGIRGVTGDDPQRRAAWPWELVYPDPVVAHEAGAGQPGVADDFHAGEIFQLMVKTAHLGAVSHSMK